MFDWIKSFLGLAPCTGCRWRPGMIVSRTGTADSPEAFRIVEAQAYYAGRRGKGGRFVKQGN